MNRMQHYSPKTLTEYHEIYSELRSKDIIIFAGGTDVMVGRYELPQDAIIIDISGIAELEGIEKKEDKIFIGSSTTLNEILNSYQIQNNIPILIKAIKTMASEQIRNRATIGGNIGNASPAGDTITPLIVLGAEIEIFSPESNQHRIISIDELFCGPCATTLKKGEIITKIIIPLLLDNTIIYYFRKIGQRNAMTITKASLSAIAKLSEGKIEWIRLAPGSVSPVVKRMSKTEEFIKGKELTPHVINQAKEIISQEISPITDIRSTKVFRMLITQNLLENCLKKIQFGPKF
ncbi:MAG: xanthine dehydrogenase family protein subunit M [Candidatus Celaenobacter antarcticus]|nr:xanthine dehydrogenase family protein subunit M [Candidatus Celaenobacter antarcticus]